MPRCKYCKAKFEAYSSLQSFCSIGHAIAWTTTENGQKAVKRAKNAKLKAQKAKDRKKLESLKTRKDFIKDLQQAFNEFIRLRDHDQPCISCGRFDHEIPDKHTGGKWDAGHYRSVGSAPELRFVETNVHKQCKHCNSTNGLGGNYCEYRKGLINRIGLKEVEKLEGPDRPPKLTTEEVKEAIKQYRAKSRELKKQLRG